MEQGQKRKLTVSKMSAQISNATVVARRVGGSMMMLALE